MNILAIGAHPDDIEFGCGGTLMKYAEAGHEIYLLVLTSGGVGGDPEVRKKEQEVAAAYLKAKKVFWGSFQDTELPLSKTSITVIEDVLSKIQPQVVFFNHDQDTHQDHQVTHKVSLSATRYVKEVLSYEVPSSIDFQPNVFVDIGDVLGRKMELLRLHASQINKTRVEDLTILESAQSCAIFRGYQGRVKYAEGFKAVRILRSI
jgi:LmbE family N-acetylglucosaminyl deacetylase